MHSPRIAAIALAASLLALSACSKSPSGSESAPPEAATQKPPPPPVHTAVPDMSKAIIPVRVQREKDIPKQLTSQPVAAFISPSRLSSLKGTVEAEYVIAPDGKVFSVRVTSNTLNDPSAEEAFVRAIRSWTFAPQKQYILLMVSYTVGS